MVDANGLPPILQQAMQDMEMKRRIRDAEDTRLASTNAAKKSELIATFDNQAKEVRGSMKEIEERLAASAALEKVKIEERHRLELLDLQQKHEQELTAAQQALAKALEEARRDLDKQIADLRANQSLSEQALIKQHQDHIAELEQKRQDEDSEHSLAFYRLVERHGAQTPGASSTAVPAPMLNHDSSNPQASNEALQVSMNSSSLKRKEVSLPSSNESSPAPDGHRSRKSRQERKKRSKKAKKTPVVANSSSISQDSDRKASFGQSQKGDPLNQDHLKGEPDSSRSVTQVPLFNPTLGGRVGGQARQPQLPGYGHQSRRWPYKGNNRKGLLLPHRENQLPSRGPQDSEPFGETRNSSLSIMGTSSRVSAHQTPKLIDSSQFSTKASVPKPEQTSPTNASLQRVPGQWQNAASLGSPPRGRLSVNEASRRSKQPLIGSRVPASSPNKLPSQTHSRPELLQQIPPQTAAKPQFDPRGPSGTSTQHGFRRIHHQLPPPEDESLEKELPIIESLGPCGLSVQRIQPPKAGGNEQNGGENRQPPREPRPPKMKLHMPPPRQPANFRPPQHFTAPTPKPMPMQTLPPLQSVQSAREPPMQSFQIRYILRESGTAAKVVWKPTSADLEFSLTYHPQPVHAMKPSSAAHQAKYPEFEFSTLSMESFELNYRAHVLVVHNMGERTLVQKESGRLGKTAPLFIEFLTEKSCHDFVNFCRNVLGFWQIQVLPRTEEQMLALFRSHGWSDGRKQLL